MTTYFLKSYFEGALSFISEKVRVLKREDKRLVSCYIATRDTYCEN